MGDMPDVRYYGSRCGASVAVEEDTFYETQAHAVDRLQVRHGGDQLQTQTCGETISCGDEGI